MSLVFYLHFFVLQTEVIIKKKSWYQLGNCENIYLIVLVSTGLAGVGLDFLD